MYPDQNQKTKKYLFALNSSRHFQLSEQRKRYQTYFPFLSFRYNKPCSHGIIILNEKKAISYKLNQVLTSVESTK